MGGQYFAHQSVFVSVIVKHLDFAAHETEERWSPPENGVRVKFILSEHSDPMPSPEVVKRTPFVKCMKHIRNIVLAHARHLAIMDLGVGKTDLRQEKCLWKRCTV